MANAKSTVFTIDSLVTDLTRLGIETGDVLMIHAALRAVGPIEGGARSLIAALDHSVGRKGSLMMVLGAHDDWSWVNTRPEPERAALLADAEPFDAWQTPAQADIGMLAEVFRQHPGTCVTDHPEGRFAARGHHVTELLADPPWHDYHGPGSPLERLVQLGGKVLRLGADPDTVTLLHYAEYLAPVPNKRRVRRLRRVATANGPELRHIECLDDEHGIVDHPGEDYFSKILRAYLKTRQAQTGVVGNAPSELIDAKDLVDFAVRWMAEHLQ